MLQCFRLLQATNPSARLLVVNRNEQEMIRTRALEAGLGPGSIEIVAADHHDVHKQIARMTAAMALIKPCYSKIASAPTKLAEYLGCGVPCLGNSGVGDVAEILEGRQVGVAVDGFSDNELSKAVERLWTLANNPETQRRCRAVAEELFSLDGGVAAYDSLYRSLALPDEGAR